MKYFSISVAVLVSVSAARADEQEPVVARKPDDAKAISALTAAGIWVTVVRGRTAKRVVLPAMNRFTDDDLAPLKNLHHVEVLKLYLNPITGGGLRYVRHLSKLKVLRLDETRITDDDLRHIRGMKNLEMLYLSATPISDGAIKHIAVLPKLKGVDFFRTRVSQNGIAQLRRLRPKLNIIDRRGRTVP
jgi:hypothetical protein